MKWKIKKKLIVKEKHVKNIKKRKKQTNKKRVIIGNTCIMSWRWSICSSVLHVRMRNGWTRLFSKPRVFVLYRPAPELVVACLSGD